MDPSATHINKAHDIMEKKLLKNESQENIYAYLYINIIKFIELKCD